VTSTCQSSSTSTAASPGDSSANEHRQGTWTTPKIRGLRPGALFYVVELRRFKLFCLTWLRQRHPDDAQQFQSLARLFGKAVCVGIAVLTCDPCSYSEKESAFVRDVG
jgi:hypothetical protein